jgi:hypothetical protein
MLVVEKVKEAKRFGISGFVPAPDVIARSR